jgi:hypothetical protein
MGRTITWDQCKKHSDNLTKIVEINFGFGKEVWALKSMQVEVDLKLRAFANGVLIIPSPKLSDLTIFCQAHGITFDLMMAKWNIL